MKRATADHHAIRIADHLGAPLPVVLADAYECAMLVMLLYTLEYDTYQIKDLCNRYGLPSTDHTTARRLDAALALWRTEHNRKIQYRHILDTLKNEDEERAKAKGRTRAGGNAGLGEAGGKHLGVVSRERGATAVRGGRAKAARNKATHQSTGPAHR